MIMLNRSHAPKYATILKTSVSGNGRSRDLDVVQKFVERLLKDVSGFDISLSEKDLDAIGRLLAAHERSGPKTASVKACGASVSDRLRAIRIARQRIQSERMRESREREARIRAESNIIGPDGNPVNDSAVQEAVRKNIEPELHPEMTNEIDKILANNRAVMEGKPKKKDPISMGLDDFDKWKDAIVATPDGTPVPTDPSYYQNMAKVTPPGVPDVPGAVEQYKAASREWKGMPGVPPV